MFMQRKLQKFFSFLDYIKLKEQYILSSTAVLP